MTQLAIDIPQATVRVLWAQRTLAGDAVEADRIDGVTSGDMPRLSVFWREEGEDGSGGSGLPAVGMEFPLACCRRWRNGRRRRDLGSMILQTQLSLLEDPDWNRLAAIGSIRVSREFKGDEQLILGDGRIEFAVRWRESDQTRRAPPSCGGGSRKPLVSASATAGDGSAASSPSPSAPTSPPPPRLSQNANPG
jgi:hypothetical protein